MARRLPAETVATFLSRTPLLGSCQLDDLLELARQAEQQSQEAGRVVLQPGRSVAAVGLLLSGRAVLQLVDAASGAQARVDQILPGDLFGEVGLLLGSGNPLTVVAEEDCLSLMVPKPLMESVLKRNPDVSLALAKRIASRFVQVSLLGMRGGAAAAVQPPLAPVPTGPMRPAPQPEPASPAPRLAPGQIPWVEIAAFKLTPETLGLVPSSLVRKHRLLPLQLAGKKLTVGMVNPRSTEALQELRRVLHTVDPEVVAIAADDFDQTFVRLKLDTGSTKAQRQSLGRNVQVSYAAVEQREEAKAQLAIGNEVIGLFDRILIEALELGASDIHIEPDSTGVRVRFRVHGALVDRQEFIAPSFAAPLVARVKVLSELDITERRLPQDGRISAQVGRQEVNLRVSTLSVSRGEKVVVRLIDPGDVMRPLHQIFLHPDLEKMARAALAAPHGAIVVAGPTGSGKSSTLYSMINERKLGRPDTNIVTVEDPVEYMMPGVTQVPILPRVGLTFAHALRGLVRQDPDVIMIGELRDSETTTIMVEAALTGHLVLTSIHGNDATAVIQRLQHLGTDRVLLSQALSLIVVQRLAKQMCPACVQEAEVAPALLENLVARKIVGRAAGVTKLPRPVGCEACSRTGYVGRLAVQELLGLDDEVRAALAAGASPVELVERARERKRFVSFAQSAAHLIARRLLAPADALLIVAG
jgi:type IV pilus assembly protein PilB